MTTKITTARDVAIHRRPLAARLARDFKQNKYKYLLIIPVLVYLAVFSYKPMYGLVIAFKNYKPTRGIWDSAWVGTLWFETFFNDIYFWRLLRNTFTISGLSILFGFPAPILLALLLNEVRHTKFKRTVQTITYMPYFISLVIMCSIIIIYAQENGLFSQISELFGGTRRNFMIRPESFRPIYVISGIWQNIGWNSIIYLAALSSIDQQQYEAARIDGANRYQQVIHITLLGILPTIMILFVLRMGSILNVGYEKVLLLYTPNTYEVADVFSTYIYRMGLENQRYSLSTAVGLFNTMVNVIFLVSTNWLSKRATNSSLF